MRPQTTFLLLLTTLLSTRQASAQDPTYSNWHAGAGLNLATINFHQNGAGAFMIPVRYDFINRHNASFSLGTHFMAGTEDEYGVSFPILVAFLAIADGAGAHAADFTDNASDTGKNGYSIRFYTNLPLLLHYNVGYGSHNEKNRDLGWFIGGGASMTVTGYTYEEGHQKTTSFWGLVLDGGLHFPKNGELGFSVTRPFVNPIGTIQNPLLFQLRLCVFIQ